MPPTRPTRRDLLRVVAAAPFESHLSAIPLESARPLVSIVKIRNGNIDYAVEHAIDLLGGMSALTRGKERILLKPNLMGPQPNATTKPAVIDALARLMKAAGKEVSIAEGSAAASPFNVRGSEVLRTTKKDVLNGLQQYVFDQLGYTDLARSLRVPLINLHTGELVDVKLLGAFVFDKLTIHRSLVETGSGPAAATTHPICFLK